MRNTFSSRWFALSLTLACTLPFCGCGPSYTEDELGTIVYEVPDVPGSDKEFPLPDLNPDAEEAQENDKIGPMFDEASLGSPADLLEPEEPLR